MKEYQAEIETMQGVEIVYVIADDIASAVSKLQRTYRNIIAIKQVQPGTIKAQEKLGGLDQVPFGC